MPTADTTELDRQRRAAPDFGLFSTKLSDRDAPPLARRSDPATAHDAAEDSRPRHKGQKATILAAYRGYGPMTAEEVSAIVGFGAWRRVAELHKAGALRDSGNTRQNATGSDATVYEAVP